MASFGWLHLTDLHQGLANQRWLWPSVKEQFFRDLEALHSKSGPWDVVLFTGDLTQRGSPEEFEKLSETLDKLMERIGRLGSRPALITVPGNHDLARPKVNSAVRSLRGWDADPGLREEFWSSADNEYRAVVAEAFRAYEAFAARWQSKGLTVRRGELPGDTSVSYTTGDGVKVALVGLNSAYLQLEGGDYTGKLDLDPRQLHGVCGDDPPEWLASHHVALLLTHHPLSWLSRRALDGVRADLAPPGRFLAHLFGHMHEGGSSSASVAGATRQRAVQGPSLFGLETWGDGQEQRLHGYMAGRVDLDGARGRLHLWPRELRKNRAGAWQMAPDYNFQLADEATTEEFAATRAFASTTRAATSPEVSSDPPTRVAARPAAGLDVNALNGPQLRDLQGAIIAAFPNTSSLARMVLFHMNTNLAEISAGNLTETTFELIRWARSRGRLAELVTAALAENPTNPELQRFASLLGLGAGSTADAPTAAGAHVPPAASPRPPVALDEAQLARELRNVLASLYPSGIDATRVASDAGISRARVEFGGSAQTVWFNLIDEARKSGSLHALVRVCLGEYPRNPNLLRLSSALPTPGAAGAPTAYALYDAIVRLLPAQFEEVLFRMSVPAHYLPSQSASQTERATALLRLIDQQGATDRLRGVVLQVGGRIG